jgi:hypothetical protein
MDIENKTQLLNYLKRQMSEQDKAILKGDKYINKNWRLITSLKIKNLEKDIVDNFNNLITI